MRMRFNITVSAVVSILLTVAMGCRARNTSSVKHSVGSTAIDSEPLSKCENQDNDLLSQHLLKLAQYMVLKNPQTFKDQFAIENFCFSVDTSSEVNAWASAQKSAIINFNRGMYVAARTEAEIAIILGHEMAHITMGHMTYLKDQRLPTEMKITDPNYEVELKNFKSTSAKAISASLKNMEASDKLTQAINARFLRAVKNPEIQQLHAKYLQTEPRDSVMEEQLHVAVVRVSSTEDNRKVDEAKKASDTAEAAYKLASNESQVVMERLALIRKPFDLRTTDEKVNWTEQEADEVGLEFYLRAGYPAESATWLHKRRIYSGSALDNNHDVITQCLKGKTGKNIDTIRGSASHPSSCWRVYDLANELDKHKVEYQEIITKTPSALPLTKPSFDEVKISIDKNWKQVDPNALPAEITTPNLPDEKAFADAVLKNINSRLIGCWFDRVLVARVEPGKPALFIQIVGRDEGGIAGRPIHKWASLTDGPQTVSRDILALIPSNQYRSCKRRDVNDADFETKRTYIAKVMELSNLEFESCRVLSVGEIKVDVAGHLTTYLAELVKADGELNGVWTWRFDLGENARQASQKLASDVLARTGTMCKKLSRP